MNKTEVDIYFSIQKSCADCVKNRDIKPYIEKKEGLHFRVLAGVKDYCHLSQQNGICESKKIFDQWVCKKSKKTQRDIEFCCRCCASKGKPITESYMSEVLYGNKNKFCPALKKKFKTSGECKNSCDMKVLKIMEGMEA